MKPSYLQPSFSEKADAFVSEIQSSIYPKLPFEKEINYVNCKVEIINDDFSTMWVKWGKDDCKFIDLPITAMATIADNIIRD